MLRNILSSLSAVALGVGLGCFPPSVAMAVSPDTAPNDLVTILADIEAAANRQDLDQVMTYYSEDFASNSGFDYSQLRQTLSEFWQQYDNLTYDVELLSWESLGNGEYTVETVTRVEGTMVRPERNLTLTAEVESRQRIADGQVVSQEILTENNQLAAGEDPPTIEVKLPNTVTSGQTFAFDTVVVEPLEGRALMGVAVDEGVTARDFLSPRPIVLDVLSAGGLYKLGTAPETTDQRWISAVILREDGLVINTQRIQVVDENAASN